MEAENFIRVPPACAGPAARIYGGSPTPPHSQAIKAKRVGAVAAGERCTRQNERLIIASPPLCDQDGAVPNNGSNKSIVLLIIA